MRSINASARSRLLTLALLLSTPFLPAEFTSAQSSRNVATTFMGGYEEERVQGLVRLANGTFVVCGETCSDFTRSGSAPPCSSCMPGGCTFPTSGFSAFPAATPFDNELNQNKLLSNPPTDGYVAVLSSDLSTVLHWTYIGGSATDRAYGVAAGSQETIWVCGFTDSATILNSQHVPTLSTFPGPDPNHTTNPVQGALLGTAVQPGAYPPQPPYQCGGTLSPRNVFVAQFSGDLQFLRCVYVIGSDALDTPRGCMTVVPGQTAPEDKVYLSGSTQLNAQCAALFPKTIGQSHQGGSLLQKEDAFVLGVNGIGVLLFSTLLGGTGDDMAYAGIRHRSLGGGASVLYVGGQTNSVALPASVNTTHGDWDAFVAKIDLPASGSVGTILATRFVGGSGEDRGGVSDCFELDAANHLVLSGTSMSSSVSSWSWDLSGTATINTQHSQATPTWPDSFLVVLREDFTAPLLLLLRWDAAGGVRRSRAGLSR